jgi:hypothetical protein
VTVAADPTVAAALSTVVESTAAIDRDCVDYSISAQAPSDTATALADPAGAKPDLWLPDSSLWLLRTLRSTGTLPQIATSSVVSTVPVVIGRTDQPQSFATWQDVLRAPGQRIGDPLTASPADAAILSALAETEVSNAGTSAVADSLVPLAQAFALPENDAHDIPDILGKVVSSGGTGVVTEQAMVDYTASNPAAPLWQSVPVTGAYFLDYPLAVTATPGPEYADTARAGRSLASLLAGDVAQKTLSASGFRPSSAVALRSGGVGAVTALQVRDPGALEEILRDWAVLALPLRTLVLEDVSGSMAAPFADSTRMQLTVDASLSADSLFNDRTQMGMWAFSTDQGPDGQDWRELVPLQGVTAFYDGKPQRQAILDAVRTLPSLVGGDTGLYDSTLAAFRTVKAGYDPNFVNSIILMTDGANEDPGSISLPDLVATLEREQDPLRPVVIVTVGITGDADAGALQQISAATGGTSWIAQDPRDISNIFVEALSARKSRL